MAANPEETLTPIPPEHRPVDEYANLITHALGLIFSIVGSVVLMARIVKSGQAIPIFACGIYSASLMGLYAASTLSHMFHDLAWRRFFRTLDQACIFLLIAGSFTPIAVVLLWDHWWITLLLGMWILAIAGVFYVFRKGRLTPAMQLTYGFLGWLPILSMKTLYELTSFEICAWFLAGGLFYSLGAVFLRFDRQIRYFHAMWHIFVMAGSTCHYVAILLVVS